MYFVKLEGMTGVFIESQMDCKFSFSNLIFSIKWSFQHSVTKDFCCGVNLLFTLAFLGLFLSSILYFCYL